MFSSVLGALDVLTIHIGDQLGIRYVYESPAARPAARRGRDAAGGSTLSERLSHLPPELIEELRQAAIQGRAKRLESLADQARQYSEAASDEIRALARNFQYDAMVSALDSRTRDEA